VTSKITDNDELIQNVDFEKALGDRYLAYALSTIMSRSLPDVRDGLKPVHRRLIYAMQQLHLNPNSGFKKCARVVGDVMGKFHPHGDAAIYGAMVRLAQDFSVRYPLIDGQGNFGNIDGDSAAAMRYTEARLSDAAVSLMEGLNENAVDFRSTYDNEGEEPTVFPATFPNLLANGSSGIAVGMATSIPPHNLDELCEALIYLIDTPNASIADLVAKVPGPDFPTGGVLVESGESILRSYETGRGSFRLRAKWQVEEQKGGLYRIIVTEIPYQVEKSKLIEKIANLLSEKKLPLLDDVQDESTDQIRMVLVPKSRNVDPDMLMESLFRVTDLDVRISLNMNVLDHNNVPKVMSLKEVLQAFLHHRLVVLRRRTEHRLSHIVNRLEILSGYLIAYLNIDEVIAIIRDEDNPKEVMMERFNLTENQVEAILNMRLRALRKLQEIEIRQEHDALSQEQEELKGLLENPKKQWKSIQKDFVGIQKKFGKNTELGKRRTQLADAPIAIELPDFNTVEKEDVTLICSDKNWIRTIKGHNAQDIKYKDGDKERFVFNAQTTDRVVFVASNGRFYTLGVDKLPRTRGPGEALRLLVDLPNVDDIINVFILSPGSENTPYLLVGTDARGFLVEAKDMLAQTKAGKQVLVPSDQQKTFACLPVVGDHVALIGENRKLIVYPVTEIPTLSKGKGVTLQKYKDGSIADMKLFNLDQGLSYSRGEKKSVITDLRPWLGKRAGAGRLAPIGFSRNNKFHD
jgi:topoisomerase-4 subunit A